VSEVSACHLLQVADDLITEAIAQLNGFDPARRPPLIALAKFIGYRQN
jgi:geranylgeranyl diphosphate synthase type II